MDKTFTNLLWVAKAGNEDFVIGGYYKCKYDMLIAKLLYKVLYGDKTQFIEDRICSQSDYTQNP